MTHTDIGGRSYCDVRDRTEGWPPPSGPRTRSCSPCPTASPTKWHRAHTTWFFEEFVLGPHVEGYQVVDADHRYLFNSYYEAVGRPAAPAPPRHGHPAHGVARWATTAAGSTTPWSRLLGPAALDAAVAALVELGLHHEQQHQELLLMDAKHLLFQNPLRPAYLQRRTPRAPRGPDPGRRPRRTAGSATTAGWSRSATTARASPTTTRARATPRTCTRSPSPTGWSPAATGSSSWTTAATAGSSCGSATAGPPCRPRAGTRPCTGTPTAPAGGSCSP